MKPLRLFSLAALLLANGCEKVPVAIPVAAGAEEANLTFQGFKVRASHEGQLVWQADAQRAKVFQQADRAEAEQVTLHYFQNGRQVSQVQADRADMNLKDYGVKVRGHVVVTGRNGVVLKTSQLDWDNERQLATSQARVEVKRKGTVLTGWGFRADRALQDVRILNDVQAEADSVKDLRLSGEGLKP